MAAGHVVVVLLVAAIVGSLLNAAGIRKTANGQPVGVRRDVARFFAEPLYDISHALQIDELRKGIQSIAGSAVATTTSTRRCPTRSRPTNRRRPDRRPPPRAAEEAGVLPDEAG